MPIFSRRNRTFSLTTTSSRRRDSLNTSSPLALAAASASASLNTNSSRNAQLSAAAAATALKRHDSLTVEALDRVRRQQEQPINQQEPQSFNMRSETANPGTSSPSFASSQSQARTISSNRPGQRTAKPMKQTLRQGRPQNVAGLPLHVPGRSNSVTSQGHAHAAAEAAHVGGSVQTIRHNSLTSTSAPVETVLSDGTRVVRSTTTTNTGPHRTMSLTTTTIRNLGSFQLISTKTEAVPDQSPARQGPPSVAPNNSTQKKPVATSSGQAGTGNRGQPVHHHPSHPHYRPQFAPVKEEDSDKRQITSAVAAASTTMTSGMSNTTLRRPVSVSGSNVPGTYQRPASVVSSSGSLSGRSLRPNVAAAKPSMSRTVSLSSRSSTNYSSSNAPVTLTIAPNGRIISRTNSLTSNSATLRPADKTVKMVPRSANASTTGAPMVTHSAVNSFPPGPIRRTSSTGISTAGSSRSRRTSLSPARSSSSRISFSDTPDYSEHHHVPPSRTFSPAKPALKTRGRAGQGDSVTGSTASATIPETDSGLVEEEQAQIAEKPAELANEEATISKTNGSITPPEGEAYLAERARLESVVDEDKDQSPQTATNGSVEKKDSVLTGDEAQVDHSESEPSSEASAESAATENTVATPITEPKSSHFEAIPGTLPNLESETVEEDQNKEREVSPLTITPEKDSITEGGDDLAESDVASPSSASHRKIIVDELDELKRQKPETVGSNVDEGSTYDDNTNDTSRSAVKEVVNEYETDPDETEDNLSGYATADEEARKSELVDGVTSGSASPLALAPIQPLHTETRRKAVAFQDSPELPLEEQSLPPKNPLRRNSSNGVPDSLSLAETAAGAVVRVPSVESRTPRQFSHQSAAAAMNAMTPPTASTYRAHVYRALATSEDGETDYDDDTASVGSRSSFTRQTLARKAGSLNGSTSGEPRRMTSLRVGETSVRQPQRKTSLRKPVPRSGGNSSRLSPAQPPLADIPHASSSRELGQSRDSLSVNAAAASSKASNRIQSRDEAPLQQSEERRSAVLALAASNSQTLPTLRRQDSASSFEKASTETRSRTGFARFSLRSKPEEYSNEVVSPAPVTQVDTPSLRPPQLTTHQEVSGEAIVGNAKPQRAADEPFHSRFADSDSDEDFSAKHHRHHPHFTSPFKSLRSKGSNSGLQQNTQVTEEPAYTYTTRTGESNAVYSIENGDDNYTSAKLHDSHMVVSKKKKFKGLRKLFGITQA